MTKALKKSLLVVLAIILLVFPLIGFGGCGNSEYGNDGTNVVKINNVEYVYIDGDFGTILYHSYKPYNKTVWYDKAEQRMWFYIDAYATEYHYVGTKIDVPASACAFKYYQTTIEQN